VRNRHGTKYEFGCHWHEVMYSVVLIDSSGIGRFKFRSIPCIKMDQVGFGLGCITVATRMDGVLCSMHTCIHEHRCVITTPCIIINVICYQVTISMFVRLVAMIQRSNSASYLLS
jgi:hypothetical protein